MQTLSSIFPLGGSSQETRGSHVESRGSRRQRHRRAAGPAPAAGLSRVNAAGRKCRSRAFPAATGAASAMTPASPRGAQQRALRPPSFITCCLCAAMLLSGFGREGASSLSLPLPLSSWSSIATHALVVSPPYVPMSVTAGPRVRGGSISGSGGVDRRRTRAGGDAAVRTVARKRTSSSASYSSPWRGFRDARRARANHAAGSVVFCGRWSADADSSAGVGRGGSSGVPRRGGAMLMNSGSGVWSLQDDEEWEFEDEVQRLERRLDTAVKRQNYVGAAKARDKLYRIHMDETSAVLSTNSAFYAAFTAKDADRMASLWLPSNDVMCIHPGDEPIVGHQAVARSWRSLFSSGDARFSASIIKPTDVKIRLRGTTAIVHCNEEVTNAGTSQQQQQSWLSTIKAEIASRAGSGLVEGEGSGSSTAMSAGIGGAIPAAIDESSATGGKGVTGGSGAGVGGVGAASTKKRKKPRYLNVTNIFRKAGGRWLMVHHHASLPPPPQTSKDLRAAMGLGGLQLGDGADGISRIINLGDQSFNLDSAKFDGKLDDMIESLRAQLPGGGAFSLGSINSATGRTQPHGMLVIGQGDDNDDDDEDDDEDDEEDDDGEGRDSGDAEFNEEQKAAWRWTRGVPLTENLTKKTMQALRKLGEEKLLGRREQRRLITDVIQHAAGDRASGVEVAYELLLAHKNEDLKDHDSLTEFIDQCKILASILFEDDRREKRED